MCQAKYIKFLATMTLKSIPTETYFILNTFEPTDAYYRDIYGDILEINETGMRLAFIPNADENPVAYIVTEETALTIKFLPCNYTPELDEYWDDDTNYSIWQDLHGDSMDATYNALYEEGLM